MSSILGRRWLFVLFLVLGFPLRAWAEHREGPIGCRHEVAASSSHWLSQPLVWVIGGLVFILIGLLVARSMDGDGYER
ncbi:hypothetical protein [Bergeyella sp. RCAD1439]|uniref:hypothetical protein n=1 Tax=Bergeyella anatis TaxID=3113737 RepID=UPI002E170E07|nr:hypothetical protein [Bergeyella sp. RCAD1439]